MNPSPKEVEMTTSIQSTSEERREAINSMTASLDMIKLEKRFLQKKLAVGTLVE